MTHDEFLEAMAIGGLSAELQKEADEHIATCPQCRAVNSAPAAASSSPLLDPWWLAIAATLFLALWIWREVGIRVARERVASERAEVVELKNERDVIIAQRDRLVEQLAIMSSPSLKTIALTGREAASAASAKLFLDPSAHRAVLVATGLPNSGPDLEYQVWLHASDPAKPARAAVFDSTAGHGVVAIESFPADVKSVSVTLEKNGGAGTPGPQLVLEGAI